MTKLNSHLINTFEPADSKVSLLSETTFPKRDFVRISCSPDLTMSQVTLLQKLAESPHIFPATNPRPGRSLFAHIRSDASWPYDAVKMKGAAGLECDSVSKTFKLFPANPGRRYGTARHLHISLTANLDIIITCSEPKPVNSITAERAANEFDCQALLAENGIGFKPILAGKYKDRNTGNDETDFLDRATGSLFIEHRRNAYALTRKLEFIVADLGTEDVMTLIPSSSDKLQCGFEIAKDCINNYLSLLKKAAKIKLIAACEAGIARHSSQTDNFLTLENGDILISDTDTCLKYSKIPSQLKGPQLLRDISSDINHWITNLAYYAYSGFYLENIFTKKIRPFEHFFNGFYDGIVNPALIQQSADHMHRKYCEFIEQEKRSLEFLAEACRKGILEGSRAVDPVKLRSKWIVTHFPLLTDLLLTNYVLIKNSSLDKRGFVLPNLGTEVLYNKFKKGIINFLLELSAESSRTSKTTAV